MQDITTLDTIIIEPEVPPNACVIWLHGLGADGHDFAPIVPQFQFPPELHIRFIFPHAPIRSVTINANMKMRAWYDIYHLGRLDKEDQSGIEESQTHVNALINEQLNAGVDSKKIILAGFSQGGAIALFTGLRYEKPLGGIMALSSYLPLRELADAEAHATNHNTPIFLAHGTNDEVLPIKLGNITKDYLQRLEHHIQWQIYPMGHEVCLEEIKNINQWLVQTLTNPI